jgi:hypothetical protein
MLHVALATAAALVGLAFAMSTYERWLAGRGRHHLAWSAALLLFALAAGALAAGEGVGWSEPVFRAYFLLGAVVNVPFLALGTVYLLGGRRRGDQWAVVVVVFSAFAAGVVAVAPFTGPLPVDTVPRGSEVFGALPRILAAVASGAAALVVFGGAAWSAWRIRRGRAMWGNVLIALGTLILANSGLLNSVLDEITGFVVTLVLGITVLFAGFLVATAPRPSAAPAAAPSPPSRQAVTARS